MDTSIADVVFENKPGTVYIASLTGPVHQAIHEKDRADTLNAVGLGRCLSMTVQLRCALFSAARARGGKTTPCPEPFFKALTASLTESLAQLTIRVPSLQDCQRCHDDAGDISAMEGPSRKRKAPEKKA